MTQMVTPLAQVAPPPRVPLPFDLLSVATVREPAAGDRWENGVEWETLVPYPVGKIGPLDCGGGTVGLPKPLDPLPSEFTEATSFVTYGWFRCSPTGWTVAEARQRAMDRLLATETAGAEHQVWTGLAGATPFLSDAPTELAEGETGVALSVGLLDEFIGDTYGAVGVIHCTRAFATVAIAASAMEVRNGRLFSVLGTPVVAGAGYPGTGPANADPDGATQWAYATPSLLVYRSEVFSPDDPAGSLLDRGKNDLYAIAERRWLVGWDGTGVGAVLTDLTTVDGSGPTGIVSGNLTLATAADGALVIGIEEP